MSTSTATKYSTGITTIRLDPELREWLAIYAKKNRRSINSAVNYLVQCEKDRDAQHAGDR